MTQAEQIVAIPGHTLNVIPSRVRDGWLFGYCQCGRWCQLELDHVDLVRMGSTHAQIAVGPPGPDAIALGWTA